MFEKRYNKISKKGKTITYNLRYVPNDLNSG